MSVGTRSAARARRIGMVGSFDPATAAATSRDASRGTGAAPVVQHTGGGRSPRCQPRSRLSAARRRDAPGPPGARPLGPDACVARGRRPPRGVRQAARRRPARPGILAGRTTPQDVFPIQIFLSRRNPLASRSSLPTSASRRRRAPPSRSECPIRPPSSGARRSLAPAATVRPAVRPRGGADGARHVMPVAGAAP